MFSSGAAVAAFEEDERGRIAPGLRADFTVLTRDPTALVSVQILDGLGAGIFGVVSVLVVADLTQGTGRFNLTHGAISTATGLGASLSHLVSGLIVQHFGYNAAFFALAGVASIALACFWIAMPETTDARRSPPHPGTSVATPTATDMPLRPPLTGT